MDFGVEKYVNFISENYIWFIIIGVVLVMAIIGYYAEKTDFGRKKDNEKKTKKEKIKKENISEIEENVKEEKQVSFIDDSKELSTQVLESSNSNLEENLAVPFGNSEFDKQEESVKSEENGISNEQDLEPISNFEVDSEAPFGDYKGGFEESNSNFETASKEIPFGDYNEDLEESNSNLEVNSNEVPFGDYSENLEKTNSNELEAPFGDYSEDLEEPFSNLEIDPKEEIPFGDYSGDLEESNSNLGVNSEVPFGDYSEDLEEPFSNLEESDDNQMAEPFGEYGTEVDESEEFVPEENTSLPTYEELFGKEKETEIENTNEENPNEENKTEELINRLKELNLPNIDSLKSISEKMQSEDDVWKF